MYSSRFKCKKQILKLTTAHIAYKNNVIHAMHPNLQENSVSKAKVKYWLNECIKNEGKLNLLRVKVEGCMHAL